MSLESLQQEKKIELGYRDSRFFSHKPTVSNSLISKEQKLSSNDWLLFLACEVSVDSALNWQKKATVFLEGIYCEDDGMSESQNEYFLERHYVEEIGIGQAKVYRKKISADDIEEILSRFHFPLNYRLKLDSVVGVNLRDHLLDLRVGEQGYTFKGERTYGISRIYLDNLLWCKSVVKRGVKVQKFPDFSGLPKTLSEPQPERSCLIA